MNEIYHHSKYEILRNKFLNQKIDFNKIYENSKNLIKNYKTENFDNTLPIDPHESESLLAYGLKKMNLDRFKKLFLQNHFLISQLTERDINFTMERFEFLKIIAEKDGKII